VNGTPLKAMTSELFCTVPRSSGRYAETPRGIAARPSKGEDANMNLSGETLLVILIVGIAAGWLAGQFLQGTGLGLAGDILAGIAGAFMASWIFLQLGIHLGTGIVSATIEAAIGAVLLLVTLRLIHGRGRWGGSSGGMWRKRW
jgi:uncharacterized membrane protein YeaQ/YmgE (transglycosylase-associated protein family)